ncbi:unnamed protein product [Acanthoscelides obtectus]|nr:unnamed protein product [Acanthoscelides obtectus]CAK1644625.1 hypothetical protein AOBTE_LOCUS13898 [Acanthoscelides obtectus]
MLVSWVYAQRPSYAGTSVKGVPELASRFKDPADVNVVNRVGVDDVNAVTEPIPVDARGDVKLVQRVNTWPKENRPFWVLNADQIERHRNTRPGWGLQQQQATGNNLEVNQEQRGTFVPDQRREATLETDQTEADSNQQQRRIQPDQISSRSGASSRNLGAGYGRRDRALFTPEEVLWDARESRLRNRNY